MLVRLLYAGMPLLTAAALAVSAGVAGAAGSGQAPWEAAVTKGSEFVAAAADAPISTAVVTLPIAFPMIGPATFSDTYLACRDGCARKHLGQDVMAAKMSQLVATETGVISYLRRETSTGGGNYLSLRGDSGWSYNYIHLNNDTPGTDDGLGTSRYAFAPGLRAGLRVVRGQLLGWVGDSGNAESTSPHLHIELRNGDAWTGTVYNPYASLKAAPRLTTPTSPSAPHAVGTLVTTAAGPGWAVVAPDNTKQSISATVLAANGYRASSVLSLSPAESGSYRTLPSWTPPRDGVVARDPANQLWVVTEGTRIRVTSVELPALGIDPAVVVPLTAADLALLPISTASPGTNWRDGSLVRMSDAAGVWYIDGAVRRPVPDQATMVSHGWTAAAVRVLPATADDTGAPDIASPLIIRDGAMVITPTGTVGQVSAGQFRWLPNWSIGQLYGLNKLPLLSISPAAAALLPAGPALP